jgi:hypothetical protein
MGSHQPNERWRPHPEEIYQSELAATEVSRGVARFMTWSFVAIVFSVPCSQLALELARGQPPQAFALFSPLLQSSRYAMQAHWAEAKNSLATMVSRQHLRSFESELERSHWAKSFFQPRVQEIVTRFLGFGNDKGTLGRDGWLFYQPGLDYIAGPDFTDSRILQAAAKKMVDKEGETDPTPDPRPALLHFHETLRGAGIHLVIMPVPDKAMLQPRELTRRLDRNRSIAVPNNRGYMRFVERLRHQGVDVFDCAPETVNPGEIRYLIQDTHWTPVFMEQAAQELARHIRSSVSLPAPQRNQPMHIVERRVARLGDLVDMLKLPAGQRLFVPQTVTIRQIVDDVTGKPWQADAEADVLLVGDSFTNVFSQAGLGWGQSAGLAEHLSYDLQRPVDVLALNGGGVWATRSELARHNNLSRLAAKRVVIYEFAIRDLLAQNWKSVQFPSPEVISAASKVQSPSSPTEPVAPATTPAESTLQLKALSSQGTTDGELVLIGRIVKISAVPRPGTAPYKDCVTFIKFEVEHVEAGIYDKPAIIAAFLAMKDNVWLPAANYAISDRFRMKLIPFRKADPAIRSMQRADDLDDIDLRPYYSLEEKRQ